MIRTLFLTAGLLFLASPSSLSAQVFDPDTIVGVESRYSAIKAVATLYRGHHSYLTESEPLQSLRALFPPVTDLDREFRLGTGLHYERYGSKGRYFGLGLPYFYRDRQVVAWAGAPDRPQPIEPAPVERSELDVALRIEYGKWIAVDPRTHLALGAGLQFFYYAASNRVQSGVELLEVQRLYGYQLFPSVSLYRELTERWLLHLGADPLILSLAGQYGRSQGTAVSGTSQFFDFDVFSMSGIRAGVAYRWEQ